MAEHIDIPQNSALGRLVRSVVDQGQIFRNQVDILATAMETRLTESDYSVIESDLSLQPGQGAEIYTMITGAKAALYRIGTAADVDYGAGKLVEMQRRLGI